MITVILSNRGEILSIEGAIRGESLTFHYEGKRVRGIFLDGEAIATIHYDGDSYRITGIFPGKARDKGMVRIVSD